MTKIERLATRDLETEVTEEGVTWLDQELAAGATLSAPRAFIAVFTMTG